PVWAPIVVSLALVGVGIAAARRMRDGGPLRIARWQVAAGVAGGTLVVGSFLVGTPDAMAGGAPGGYPWPVFVAGMALAGVAAVAAFAGG
ncbi:MAG TPA: hypothetical protein VMT69_00460, partial [Kineosporiaceae bacterium]|nr:hypothetical protein [Kineosporiaceae bacterium]